MRTVGEISTAAARQHHRNSEDFVRPRSNRGQYLTGKQYPRRSSASKAHGGLRVRQSRPQAGQRVVGSTEECGTLRLVSFVLLFCVPAGAQTAVPTPASAAAQTTPPPDTLGRTTPRGTVLGFFKVARNGHYDAAAQYLNTERRGQAAANLAHELFVIMDRRLPARLNELSDRPEGSLAFPAKPDQDLVGTISGESGNIDLLLERVDREEAAASGYSPPTLSTSFLIFTLKWTSSPPGACSPVFSREHGLHALRWFIGSHFW